MFFAEIPNTLALLQEKGAMFEATLHTRDRKVFAKVGKSYHMLTGNGGVRGSHASWVDFAGEKASDLLRTPLCVELRSDVPNLRELMAA